MAKHTHITAETITDYVVRKYGRVKALCNVSGSWGNMVDASAADSLSAYMPPLCPKCAEAAMVMDADHTMPVAAV
jgi:hypothetical protein